MNVMTHIESLPENDARDFGRIVRLLKAQPEAEPSPGLHGRIAAQLPKRPRLPKAWWWVPVAASLAVVFSLASMLQNRSPSTGKNWLAENQEADGTWDPARHGGVEAFRPALTALALLALRQEGEAAYPGQVAKGASALIALQAADGAFGGDDGQAKLYNLAMATYALAVCGADAAALSRAIGQIRSSQGPDGSWTYTQEGSAAVTAWMTRALACAEAHGHTEASVPLRKGLLWLRGHVRDDGRMAYHPTSAPSDTLTALSAYSLIEAGGKFPDLQTLGIRMTDALGIQPSSATAPDCYRDYAKIIAFESAGKTASAENIRKQVRQRRQDNPQDQWRIAGGKLYTVALTTLCRAQ